VERLHLETQGAGDVTYIDYTVEITELISGITRRVPAHVPWNEYSPKVWREKMCDCNIAGYFKKGQMIGDKWEWDLHSDHMLTANPWRIAHGCDHSMPPTRFKVGAAHLADGRVVEFCGPTCGVGEACVTNQGDCRE
jgi:hypothetical protein